MLLNNKQRDEMRLSPGSVFFEPGLRTRVKNFGFSPKSLTLYLRIKKQK